MWFFLICFSFPRKEMAMSGSHALRSSTRALPVEHFLTGHILEEFPRVDVSALELSDARRLNPKGGGAAHLTELRIKVWREGRGQPVNALRIADLRPEGQRHKYACVRVCRAIPHKLSHSIFGCEQGDFAPGEEEIYLLLTLPQVGPAAVLKLLPMRYVPEAPFLTEIFRDSGLWKFGLTGRAGALTFQTLVTILGDKQTMLVHEGNVTRRIGVTDAIERLTTPTGWVEPLVVLGRVAQGVIDDYLRQGFLAYLSGDIGIVIPSPEQSTESGVSSWRLPENVGAYYSLRLQACEAGGAMRKPKEPAQLKKGSACLVCGVDGRHLPHAVPFSAPAAIPCGVQAVYRSMSEELVTVTYEWSADKPAGYFKVVKHRVARDGSLVTVRSTPVIDGTLKSVFGSLQQTETFSPVILAAKAKSEIPDCVEATNSKWKKH